MVFQNWRILGVYTQRVFLTVPPNFQYQNEKWWAANQSFCSIKFLMYKKSSLVEKRFSFYYWNLGRTVKKTPCIFLARKKESDSENKQKLKGWIGCFNWMSTKWFYNMNKPSYRLFNLFPMCINHSVRNRIQGLYFLSFKILHCHFIVWRQKTLFYKECIVHRKLWSV